MTPAPMPASYGEPTVRSGERRVARLASEAGFSLPELLIATGVMLIISATATSGLLQLTLSLIHI